jgi:hypothetical protein
MRSEEGSLAMKLMEVLRKGFGYVLLSMGVSRPAPKPRPAEGAGAKPGPR